MKIKQILSEHEVKRKAKSGMKKGRVVRVFEPKREGVANHWLDCWVYVLALCDVLEQNGELSVGALTGGARVGGSGGRRGAMGGGKRKKVRGRVSGGPGPVGTPPGKPR